MAKAEIYQKKSADTSSKPDAGKAYTVKLYAQPFKGMTPAAVLAESPENREKLLALYKTLQANVEKYKMNQVQMDAIRDAVTLFDKGELNVDEGSSSAGSIVLYNSSPKPNMFKKNKDGTAPVTEMRVNFYSGDSYPFEFEIENYDAPVNEGEKENLNVVKSRAVNRVTHNYRVSFGDMRGIVARMERMVTAFFTIHFASCEKDALAFEKREREKNESV